MQLRGVCHIWNTTKHSYFAEVELLLTITACVVHINISEPLRISGVGSELVSYHGVLVNHWMQVQVNVSEIGDH